MKKRISLLVIMMLTVSFLVMGNSNADAMNHEAAALLTAGIVLATIPVIALAHGRSYPEPAYAYAGPPRHIEKTKIIYVQPKHRKHRRHWAQAYDRGYRKEWKRQEYRRGMRDARHDHRRDREYDH